MDDKEKWEKYFSMIYERTATPEHNIFLFRAAMRLLLDLKDLPYMRPTMVAHGLPKTSYDGLSLYIESFERNVVRNKAESKQARSMEKEGIYYAALMLDVLISASRDAGEDLQKLMDFEYEVMLLCKKYDISKNYYLEKLEMYESIRNDQQNRKA